MSLTEDQADILLRSAKADVRLAVLVLDPSPVEPVAQAMLKVLDTIDQAREELKRRGPGREDHSATGSTDLDEKREANG